jgi:hemerythrin-like metal-binding protein
MNLKWEASFSVGVEALDLQHQRILELIADLSGHVEAGFGSPERDRALFRLTSYVQEHFKREEEFLSVHDYPGFASHVKHHRAFAREVARYCMGTFDPTEQPRSDLLTFLEDWWSHHILEEDMAYKPYLQDKGLG